MSIVLAVCSAEGVNPARKQLLSRQGEQDVFVNSCKCLVNKNVALSHSQDDRYTSCI